MSAEICSSEREDGRVHWTLEEVEGDEDTGSSLTLPGTDVGVQDDDADGIDGKNEAGFEHCRQRSCEEATDSEDDESI